MTRKRKGRPARTGANPQLAMFLANGKRRPIASDVQCIIYRHADDGQFYAHTFGGSEVQFLTVNGQQAIALGTLPARTGVLMFGVGDAVVLQHKDGKPLSDDF